MAKPVITIYNTNNSTQLNSIDIGSININSASTPVEVLIWNNRNGRNTVSTLINASITVLDNNGGSTGRPVLEKWVQSLVYYYGSDASNELYYPIGGEDGTRPLRAYAVPSSEGNILKGYGSSNGSLTYMENFAIARLKVEVPSNANVGDYNFIFRVQGYYI